MVAWNEKFSQSGILASEWRVSPHEIDAFDFTKRSGEVRGGSVVNFREAGCRESSDASPLRRRSAAPVNRNGPETQFYYVRNRVYNPALGRGVQRYPIGYSGGINLYEYVGGRAVVEIDPMGHDAIPLPKTTLQAVTEAIIAGFLAAYLLYLARQAAKVKCAPREREAGCSSDDCCSGRPCGAVGSGRSCQFRFIQHGPKWKNGTRLCGCYAGAPDEEF
jgi:RHS repeat-associated protein